MGASKWTQLAAGGSYVLPSTTGQAGKFLQTDGTNYVWETSGLSWTNITSNTTATSGNGYFVDTSGGAFTLTLPASATYGDTVAIVDQSGSFAVGGSNNLTVARNGLVIQGNSDDMTCDVKNAAFELVYSDATNGWRIV